MRNHLKQQPARPPHTAPRGQRPDDLRQQQRGSRRAMRSLWPGIRGGGPVAPTAPGTAAYGGGAARPSASAWPAGTWPGGASRALRASRAAVASAAVDHGKELAAAVPRNSNAQAVTAGWVSNRSVGTSSGGRRQQQQQQQWRWRQRRRRLLPRRHSPGSGHRGGGGGGGSRPAARVGGGGTSLDRPPWNQTTALAVSAAHAIETLTGRPVKLLCGCQVHQDFFCFPVHQKSHEEVITGGIKG